MESSCPSQLQQPRLLAGSLPCLAIDYIISALGIEPEGREAGQSGEQQSITNRQTSSSSVQLV